MPLLDGRPPAVDTRFRPGNTFTVTLQWPAGALTGRTFTAALDATSLTVDIVGNNMVVSMTEAQTLAAANVGEFVLTETTGGISDVVITGSWHSSNGPSAGESTVVSVNESSGVVTVIAQGAATTVGDFAVAGNLTVVGELIGVPELVADNPAEVGISVVGDTATLSLLDTVARHPFNHRTGQYYVNGYDVFSASGLTAGDRLHYFPVILSAGTVDRIGCEVTTLQAGATLRMGIYFDDDGFPGNLLAEATSGADQYPLDAATTGVRTAAISAVIPRNGLYWLAVVQQGNATSAGIMGWSRGAVPWLPLGTSPPSSTTAHKGRYQTGVTGALPASATLVDATTGNGIRIHFRYA